MFLVNSMMIELEFTSCIWKVLEAHLMSSKKQMIQLQTQWLLYVFNMLIPAKKTF